MNNCIVKQPGKSYFICKECGYSSLHEDLQDYYIDKLQDRMLVCPGCGSKKIYYKTYEAKSIPVKIKVGRNDKCPCGSNVKYKKCCGKV